MIVFDEVAHTYTDQRTGAVLPSVTQIIGKVYGTGLENAPSHFVERAAEKGTIIHKEIETYLKTGKHGESKEFEKFWHWFSFGGCTNMYTSEQIINAKTTYGSFAGTVDFFANGFIYDWKTCKTATKKQIKKWQMQLSFYCYALRQMGKSVNEPLKVAHITDKVEFINVDYLGDEWVENTVKMYYEGEKVENKPETSLQTVDEKTLAHFGDVLKQIAELEKSIEPIREQIKAEMENRKILALKAGNVSVTYVCPTTRETFDTKRFKAENVDLYKQYTKTSEVKSSIKMKKYLITFIASDEFGDMAFQAIIDIDFDLQKEFIKCKDDKDCEKISNRIFEKNNMKQWIPEPHETKIPKRIIFFQQLYTDQYNEDHKK